MTPDAKLNALFAAARPPARDYLFEAAVAERVARRRVWATLAALTPWVLAATAALWGLRPVVGPLADSLGPALEPVGLMLASTAVTVGTALWLSGRFRPG
jgi:hypothetical protein